MDHAEGHITNALNHLDAAKEHAVRMINHAGLSKAAHSSHAKLGHELGAASAQHAMAHKHLNSLIGRPDVDGSSEIKTANSNSKSMGHHIKMAQEAHADLGDLLDNPDKAHESVVSMQEHIAKAEAVGAVAKEAIGHALQEFRAQGLGEKNDTQKAASSTALLKGALHIDKSGHFELFVPFTKILKEADGSLVVEGCASVSDYVDSQGDYFTPEALERAMKDWSTTGNIRLQHDTTKLAGTIRQPIFGKLNNDAELGWWMAPHPVTKTPAAFIRAHIVGDEAIKLTKAGVMTGFSVGGAINPGGYEIVEVEVGPNGEVLREVA